MMSLKQRRWLRSTQVRVRHLAFHVNDQASAALLHDLSTLVCASLRQLSWRVLNYVALGPGDSHVACSMLCFEGGPPTAHCHFLLYRSCLIECQVAREQPTAKVLC